MKIKKLIPLTLVVIFLSLSSCQKSAVENLIGSWKNSKTDIAKLDQIADLLYNYQVANLDEQITDYKAQLETLEGAQKDAYADIVNNLEKQKADLTVENIKTTIKQNLNQSSIIFKDDSTVVLISEIDSIVGRWNFSEEESKLNLKIDNSDMHFKISEISKEKLVLIKNNDIDTINFDVTYTFEK